jgi:hypothetical protein
VKKLKMKKITNKFYLSILAASLVLGGCKKDFLVQTPANALTPEQALSDAGGLQNALNGVYSDLRSVSLYGRDLTVMGDLIGDNAYVETKNSGRYLNQYQYNVTVNDGVPADIWTAAYTGILRANQIIDTKVTGTGVDAIKAEAYALRGLLYFDLVKVFATAYTVDPNALGVPIVLHYDPYNLPSRNKVSEVYAQIISDLKAGFEGAGAYTNSARLSKYAIEGLLAKAYLYMGDNANAKTAAVDVINSGGFTLVPGANYKSYWANPAFSTNKIETLFEVDADVINNNGFDDLGGIYINGYQDLYATSTLYSQYSATDARKSVLIESTAKNGTPAVLNDKYPNATNGDRDNIKVLRLSEVYLIAAEASLTSNESDARTYLNALVAQRDPGKVYTSTGSTLLADIVNERRKELAFEGDRLFDLNRLNWTINRTVDVGAIPIATYNAVTIPPTDGRRIAPIPQSEIQANPNIAGQQNPAYK